MVRADLTGVDLGAAYLDPEWAIGHMGLHSPSRLWEMIHREGSLGKLNLKGADLKGADLKDANLSGANLFGAKLEGVRNISAEQLSKAETLYGAHLDPELFEYIERNYPQLFTTKDPSDSSPKYMDKKATI